MSEKRFDPKRLAQYSFKSGEALKKILKEQPQRTAITKKKNALRDTLTVIFIAFLIAVIIRTFLFQIFTVPTNSMEPTLFVGDRIIINKLSYGISNPFWGTSQTMYWFGVIKNPFYGRFRNISKGRYLVRLAMDPKRMDVIVFRQPGKKEEPQKNMVKRIIALPGEKLSIKNGRVYINGKLLKVKHKMHTDKFNYGPVKIPYGTYFVLGDNRAFSSDSRLWGGLSGNNIIGIAMNRVWPPKKTGKIR